MKKQRVLIIGSGIGGLAAAALLAKDGYQVTVLEKNEQLGGRASVLVEKGYRFDMGPSWYMMPEVFERFFQEFGHTTSDFFTVHPLTPQYRVFFEDQTHLDISGNLQQDLALFETLEKGVTARFHQYLSISKTKYEVAMQHVLYKNTNSLLDLVDWNIAKHTLTLGVVESMHHHITHFFSSKKLQQILEYNLVFLGCSPQNAPALFSLMTHVDMNLGVWYPEGGMYALVTAMKKIGESLGVQYILNSPVTRLETHHSRITQVHTATRSYAADIVVSNADRSHTEDLLDGDAPREITPTQWKKKTLAPSAFLLYLGINKKLPQLTHHNLYFGDGWETHFSEVFDHPQWPVTPSIYVNMASATDPTVAPKGHENLMVLVPIATHLNENKEWKTHYAQYIIAYLEKQLGISLQKHIVYQKIFSTTDFSMRYNSLGGNALGGLAHTLFQSAVWRPNNFSSTMSNLFYSGANTVPGIGVPPAVISGHLVRDRIRQWRSS